MINWTKLGFLYISKEINQDIRKKNIQRRKKPSEMGDKLQRDGLAIFSKKLINMGHLLTSLVSLLRPWKMALQERRADTFKSIILTDTLFDIILFLPDFFSKSLYRLS